MSPFWLYLPSSYSVCDVRLPRSTYIHYEYQYFHERGHWIIIVHISRRISPLDRLDPVGPTSLLSQEVGFEGLTLMIAY